MLSDFLIKLNVIVSLQVKVVWFILYWLNFKGQMLFLTELIFNYLTNNIQFLSCLITFYYIWSVLGMHTFIQSLLHLVYFYSEGRNSSSCTLIRLNLASWVSRIHYDFAFKYLYSSWWLQKMSVAVKHTRLKLRILETDSEMNRIFARSQLTTNRKPSAAW